MEATAFGPDDPQGWWISEKFDGVRALWDGFEFFTKTGNRIAVPDWFAAGMPAGVALDGEIWAGRGNFQDAANAVRGIGAWDEIQFRPFDLTCGGFFEERQAILLSLSLPAHCVPVEQIEARNCSHYIRIFREIEAQGGEGCILRAPESLYAAGRSREMQKEKAHQDEEAAVVGLNMRPDGSVKSLVCRFADGVEFNLSAGLDSQLKQAAAAGEIKAPVTVRYPSKTKRGAPREPVLVGVRDYE